MSSDPYRPAVDREAASPGGAGVRASRPAGPAPVPPPYRPAPARLRPPGAWLPAAVALWAVAMVLSALLSGDATLMIPLAIAGALVIAYTLAHVGLARRQVRRHGGDARAAAADHTDPVPSTADVTDDLRPLGDTPEVHDELIPQDLPRGHPGRPEADREAAEHGGVVGRGG
jgi:hypothetical protein